tara:strand:+ start:1301 stop:1468 length:168 start_codon:yes stop_codon:yes gene_type:complete
MEKEKILISSFLISLSLLCYFKPKFKDDDEKYKIPKINDPWLYLQFGGPGIERTV